MNKPCVIEIKGFSYEERAELVKLYIDKFHDQYHHKLWLDQNWEESVRKIAARLNIFQGQDPKTLPLGDVLDRVLQEFKDSNGKKSILVLDLGVIPEEGSHFLVESIKKSSLPRNTLIITLHPLYIAKKFFIHLIDERYAIPVKEGLKYMLEREVSQEPHSEEAERVVRYYRFKPKQLHDLGVALNTDFTLQEFNELLTNYSYSPLIEDPAKIIAICEATRKVQLTPMRLIRINKRFATFPDLIHIFCRFLKEYPTFTLKQFEDLCTKFPQAAFVLNPGLLIKIYQVGQTPQNFLRYENRFNTFYSIIDALNFFAAFPRMTMEDFIYLSEQFTVDSVFYEHQLFNYLRRNSNFSLSQFKIAFAASKAVVESKYKLPYQGIINDLILKHMELKEFKRTDPESFSLLALFAFLPNDGIPGAFIASLPKHFSVVLRKEFFEKKGECFDLDVNVQRMLLEVIEDPNVILLEAFRYSKGFETFLENDTTKAIQIYKCKLLDLDERKLPLSIQAGEITKKLANLYFSKEDYKNALFYFKKLYKIKTHHFEQTPGKEFSLEGLILHGEIKEIKGKIYSCNLHLPSLAT